MTQQLFRKTLRYIRNVMHYGQTISYVNNVNNEKRLSNIDDFNFETFRTNTLNFVSCMSVDNKGIRFRYSASCSRSTLYASAYACMIYSFFDKLKTLDENKKREWLDYFDHFQNQDDGLFYDQVIANDIYHDSDWWGGRHLALHMISAYTALDGKPKYKFKFLSDYYDIKYMKSWLDEFNWESDNIGSGDIDNKIMNVGALLQYQRDMWNDTEAEYSVNYLKEYLLKKINIKTGLWGNFDTNDANQRSRMIQFAYHIFSLFFYDGYYLFDHDKIIAATLNTQNTLGGYGVKINSSACEDIDSIEILMRLFPYASENNKEKILASLKESFTWICLNQVDGGGFVFRLNEEFIYGCNEMSSLPNAGSMFATWFRTLAIAHLYNFIFIKNFYIIRAPGLVY